jgi:hypothetical protein
MDVLEELLELFGYGQFLFIGNPNAALFQPFLNEGVRLCYIDLNLSAHRINLRSREFSTEGDCDTIERIHEERNNDAIGLDQDLRDDHVRRGIRKSLGPSPSSIEHAQDSYQATVADEDSFVVNGVLTRF